MLFHLQQKDNSEKNECNEANQINIPIALFKEHFERNDLKILCKKCLKHFKRRTGYNVIDKAIG